jgi:hypothetical protein
MKQKLGFVLFLLFFCINPSKTQIHNEFWGRLTFTKEIKSKWILSADINLRQQADIYKENKNILSTVLMRSVRIWINHYLKRNYSIVLSPFFLGENTDLKHTITTHNKELRFALGVAKKSTIEKLILKNRVLYEPRFISPDVGANFIQHRYRLLTSILIPIKNINSNNKIIGTISNEIFYHTQNALTEFDQNRVQLGCQWHRNNTELNVMYQLAKSNNNSILTQRNQYLLMINFIL